MHYSPFLSDVPKSYVLVSDPWGYLRVSIQRQAKHHQRLHELYENAEWFVNLADEYYQAASASKSITRPLLYYYGYLNLSKAFLSLAGVRFGSTSEYHGLALYGQDQVQVWPRIPNRINVFAELMFRLKQINTIQKLVIKPGSILRVLPEIHEIGVASGAFKRRHIAGVDVDFWQSRTSHRVWYRLILNKSDKPLVKNLYARFYSGDRHKLLWQIPPDKKHINFESKRSFRYTTSPRETYKRMWSEVTSMPVFSLLTHQGYRHYILLRPWPFDQIGASYLAMFWLGSLVRYRPIDVRLIMDSVLGPVLSEFVVINPNQFLYQMTNYITHSECVKPYAHV